MTTAVKPRPTTAAGPPSPRRGPTRTSPLYWVRRGWRRLVSMRTALVLLFLLAVAAVPGSLLPQHSLNETKVAQYRAAHSFLGPILDRLGFFNVFSAPWFAAIYLLLGISLIGCLTPRIRLHARAATATPLPAPKNLSRLPESAQFTVDGEVDTVAAELRDTLGRRWRTVVRAEDGGGSAISAEKGYLRETGNLVFHVALLGALISIAAGKLYGYSASVVVDEGAGFCNAVLNYDSWRPGHFVRDGDVAPFCIDNVDKFTARYLPGGEPSQFDADVTYSRGTNGSPEKASISVNHPLRLEGDRVYLIGHGFAPRITVVQPDGRRQKLSADYIPQDPNTFFSEGAFQIQGATDAKGKPTDAKVKHTDDIGIDGFFAPTPLRNPDGTYTSAAPQANNPVLGVFVYQGDLGITGLPRSVYSLDQAQIKSGKLNKVAAANLRQGQTVTLPSGAKVTFDGWKQWVSIQVSHDPTQQYILISAVAMVVGLIGSLAVRRRRLWLRLTPADASMSPGTGMPGKRPGSAPRSEARTVVQVGGLARSDAGSFTTEFSALAARLAGACTNACVDDRPDAVGPERVGPDSVQKGTRP